MLVKELAIGTVFTVKDVEGMFLKCQPYYSFLYECWVHAVDQDGDPCYLPEDGEAQIVGGKV